MKNKHVTFIFLLPALIIFCAVGVQAQTKSATATSIHFIEQSWPQALKTAKAEYKLIFVDAYATWCGPCKQLKSTTFKNSKAAQFFNNQFINLSIDTEKGAGADLATQWGLESYPTLYIFDSKGTLILQSEGFLNAAELINFGQQALKKVNTVSN